MPPDLCKCSPNDPRVKTAVQQAERVQQRSNMRVPNYTTLFEIWWFGTWFKDFKGNPWKQTGWGEDPRSPKVSCHFSLNSQEGWTYCKYRHKKVKAKWRRNVHPLNFSSILLQMLCRPLLGHLMWLEGFCRLEITEIYIARCFNYSRGCLPQCDCCNAGSV